MAAMPLNVGSDNVTSARKGSQKSGRPEFSTAKALNKHPDRAKIITDKMTAREAMAEMKKYREANRSEKDKKKAEKKKKDKDAAVSRVEGSRLMNSNEPVPKAEGEALMTATGIKHDPRVN